MILAQSKEHPTAKIKANYILATYDHHIRIYLSEFIIIC